MVQRINITGNNVTNEDVIRGELILDEGDPSQIKFRSIYFKYKSSKYLNRTK